MDQTTIKTEVKFEAKNYISIARPGHWFKNIFVLPGAAVAIYIAKSFSVGILWALLLALVATCLVASANYVINEWIDAEFDKFHPEKKNRPSVCGGVEKKFVYLWYAILAGVGLLLALAVSLQLFFAVLSLLVMGVVYNVKPLRSKDRVYLDVLSESVNNPIRFLIGWYAVSPHAILPISLIIAYWMAGAFLMTVKRFAELRFIGDREIATLYRRSFRYYDENKLLICILFYALNFAFFFAIFMIKHRIEFLVSFPFFALLFCWYLWIGMKENSAAQHPEKLYRERKFLIFISCLVALLVFLLFYNIPLLHFFLY